MGKVTAVALPIFLTGTRTMCLEELRKKLASLEQQRARLLDGAKQLEGAIGFCKGLIAEAEAAETPCTPDQESPVS